MSDGVALEVACGRTVLLRALEHACRPRRRLTVSEWADAHRVLSSKSSAEPGAWRTARVPYLREIMDALSITSTVQRIVIMKSAQVGGTEVGLNWLGYIMHHAPAPTLVVVPTLEVRKKWVRQRLDPMLAENEGLAQLVDARRRRDRYNSEELKDFPGGICVLAGANSPASLASMPIKYVLCDEVDRFPWQVGAEGDPLGLIEERTKTFPRRKILLVSTPTVTDASRIEEEYNQSDRRRYYVPCPHCDEGLALKWANLRWDRKVTRAWYVCEHCGSEIEEHHKTRMLEGGQWVPEDPDRPARGYHISGLYAPVGLGYRWIELAREWKRVQGDPAQLRRYINTALGESWEDRSRDVKPHVLAARAEPYRLREVPADCWILTAGVDTQANRLEVQVLGWGRGETCWVIDWVALPGNPVDERVWRALTEYLNRPLEHPGGRSLRIQAVAVDSGGHYTHEVYNYCAGESALRLMSVKGSNLPSQPILGRFRLLDINYRGRTLKRGVRNWMVGSDTAKHTLFSRLAADEEAEPGARMIHFSDELPMEYYDQLTAEAFSLEKNKWVQRRGRRNEALDTWVYAAAAAHHPELRVHRMTDADWDRWAQYEDGQRPVKRRTPPAPPGSKGGILR